MTYRICKSIEIESGHQLSKHPDKCRFPHGHSRKVEFVLEADELDEHGMVCDFKIIKEAVRDLAECYDHALCMNTDDPQFALLQQVYGDRIIGFFHQEPTTEVLAKTFFEVASAALEQYAAMGTGRYLLRPSVRLLRVRVGETSSSWAEYER